MMPDNITKLLADLDEVKGELIQRVTKQDEEIAELKEARPETAKAITKLTEDYDGLKSRIKEEQEKLSQRVDEVESSVQRDLLVESEAREAYKSPGEVFTESDEYKAMLERREEKTTPVDFERLIYSSSEVKTLLTSTVATRFIEPQRLAELFRFSDRSLMVRDLFQVRRTTSNQIEYLEESGFYDAGATATITTGVETTGTCVLTLAVANSSLVEGQRIVVSGDTGAPTVYNKTHVITKVTSSTVIEIQVASGTGNMAGTPVYVAADSGGAAAMVAEGNAKAESTATFELKTASVQTLAHWLPVTRQAAADQAFLRAYINDRLLYGLAFEEEAQLLYGNGTSPNLTGLLTNTDRQTFVWSTDGVTGDTKIDAIRKAMTQVWRVNYAADGCVLNPVDWQDIELEKGSDNHYIWVNVQEGGSPRIWRLPVVVTNAINAAQGVVGNFRVSSTLWDREQASVRIADQHSTYFTENKLAILAEERLMLAVYRPSAYVDISFDSAPA